MGPSVSLASRAARGGAITMLGQVAKVIVHVAGLVVLARLLTPSDFGVLAIATIITGVGEIIRDFGLSSAAMQSRTLSVQQRSNLFWLNLAVGVFLCGVCLALAAPIGAVYENPAVGSALVALAITFALNGAQTQYQAELARSMRYVALTITDILSLVAGFGVAVGLALVGVGYWALVGQLITIAVIRLVARIAATQWIPGIPRRAPMADLVRFGVNVTVTQLIVFLSSNVDRLILGFQSSTRVVGLYQQSFQLVMTPLSQVFPPMLSVALPVLSRVQGDAGRYGRYIVTAQRALSLPLAAVFACAVAASEPLITIALGEQWGEAAPFFRVLAVAGLFQSLTYVTYWVFLSRGLTGSNMRFSLISRAAIAVFVAIGALWGPLGVAVGYAVGMSAAWPFSLWWLSRVTELPVKRLLAGGVRTIALAATAVGAASVAVLPFNGSWPSLVASALAVLLTFTAGALVPAVRSDYVDVFRVLVLIRK